ncbi:hypothetical protein [Leptospira stimsonii]|uniref:Uncharacterized protein n=1 Tax=Leptospira stimsonii TaxID=2202203 RepID=A0ABY2MUT4_9LEPT|nr:hypothetical protein [Leptospira stimsonii]TGK25263.1 hypothetical protein EHO98_02360 [Leptospira stimsonii]TGM08682.1 hypothetical protein EHQ90_21545 [Leptospira stimsonii]
MNLFQFLFLAIGVEFFLAHLTYFQLGEVNLESFKVFVRYSGRFSYLTFLILMISENHPKKIEKILSTKPYSAFAIVHGIHLSFVFAYLYLSGKIPAIGRLLPGMLAYLFIFLSPWFEKSFLQKLHPSRWTRRIYTLYIWIIFVMTFLPKIFKTPAEQKSLLFELYFFLSLGLGTLLFWIVQEWKNRKEISF